MRGNLLGMLLLLKYCVCDDMHNFDGDIKDFVVGNSKLYVLTDHRLHQMRHDLFMEKTKDFNATHPNTVTLLVPFDANGTLITCGTSNGGYCEVLDLNDITNCIYWEKISSVPQQNNKSVAFIVDSKPNDSPNGAYLLIGRNEHYHSYSKNVLYSVVKLWNTLNSQSGSIFATVGEGATPYIHTSINVEFIDGFQIVLRKLSYLFLNAKVTSGWQAFVLRLNNTKENKNDILKALSGTVLKCCSDKTRPVLLASALIPSDKAVIWTGVFSAQNERDPENTALAVYNISEVDKKVNSFCPWTDQTCISNIENEPKLEPVAVVLKYKSMSSVAAVRNGSWIVLFIGTKDGQLIKLVLDETFSPGCPTVLFRSDDDQKVLPRMHLDPVDSKHIYIALKNQIRRVSVVQCAKYKTLRDCRAALDSFCGWCSNMHRCSTQDECSNSWVSFPKDSLQKQLLFFQVAEKSSREMTLHLALSLKSTGNLTFSCGFITKGVNLCDKSDAVFPNCFCGFSDQLLSAGGLEVSATVTIEDQMITENLMLKKCPSITINSTETSYTQCVQCVFARCHWSSFLKRCDWTNGSEPQLHVQDVCNGLHSDYKEPEILSIELSRVSFHGRNNVFLTGRNLESVTKIRIQGDLDCIQKEFPVFDRSSGSLRFHVPSSGIKGTLKVCAVTADDRCHGNSTITYSSQPSCTGIQPKVTWRSGGRKIYLQGTNMEFVESIIVRPSNEELKSQNNASSGDVWFHSHPFDGSNQINLKLKVGIFIVDCLDLTYQPDPELITFSTSQVSDYILVTIKKKTDKLNLSINEVKVAGLQDDREYDCVLERIEFNAILCKITGASKLDSLTISVGSFVVGIGQSSTKYLFCLKPQDLSGQV